MVLLIVDTSLKFTFATKYLWITDPNSINLTTCCLRKCPYQNVSFYNSQFSILSGNLVSKLVFLLWLWVGLFVVSFLLLGCVGWDMCMCYCGVFINAASHLLSWIECLFSTGWYWMPTCNLYLKYIASPGMWGCLKTLLEWIRKVCKHTAVKE